MTGPGQTRMKHSPRVLKFFEKNYIDIDPRFCEKQNLLKFFTKSPSGPEISGPALVGMIELY